MDEAEVLQILEAKLQCLEESTSPYPCKCECIDCDLHYAQGNMGRQKQALQYVIKMLKQEYRSGNNESYNKRD